MKHHLLFLLLPAALVACQRDIEAVNSGLDSYYYIERMKKLRLAPAYEGESYTWTMRLADGRDSLLSREKDYVFLAQHEGTYRLTFAMDDGERGFKHSFPVIVLHESVEYKPGIDRVVEYCPAPGQFVNTMPIYEPGDTPETMRRKAEDDLANDVMITLGSWGGYVTFAFDHTVVNVAGERDFQIKGNCFYSDIPYYQQQKGGSAEPGIVMVALDRNMNGRPDEGEWYELAGSAHTDTATRRHHRVTYHRPTAHKPVPSPTDYNVTDAEYIAWDNNQGQRGFLPKNSFHAQDYYPQWLTADELTFSGTLLPPNGRDESGMGSYFVLYSYAWGYADNHPNTDLELTSFDISWAVDKDERPVHLPGVDFIRVHTGCHQVCGWLGETSTEISSATDLHITPPPGPVDPLPDE